MELRVKPYTLPEALSCNYEELKGQLLEKAAQYETVVYTEDQVKVAKEDRAALNKLKKALNDERIRREREFMQPFATFKAQINELIGIIDRPVQAIDDQVKAFEERQKAEKRVAIEACWQEVLQADGVPAAVCLSHIWDEKWLNTSVTMTTIKKAIVEKLEKIATELDVVRNLPAYAFEAEQMYLNTLDLAKAVSEAHRLEEMAKLKAAHEAEKAAQQAEPEPAALPTEPKREIPEREWIAFKALLTPEEARQLGNYLKSNGILYKAV